MTQKQREDRIILMFALMIYTAVILAVAMSTQRYKVMQADEASKRYTAAYYKHSAKLANDEYALLARRLWIEDERGKK